MLLAIEGERKAIEQECRLLARLTYKLSNQMRHFKEFNQLKLITKLTRTHLTHLQSVETAPLDTLPALNIPSFLDQNKRIKCLILRKGQQLKQLLGSGVFMSFAVLGLGCLSKLKFNLDLIESKLRALERIGREMGKKVVVDERSR